MASNADVFDFELTQEEMQELSALNRPDGGWGLPDPNTLE
jgi:diketogulonate reductase-like aldo/keto reductase